MPLMPAHRCPTCASLITGRCLTCDRRRDARRGTSCQRGYNSARWRRLRWYRLQTEPLCRACLAVGRITAADTVDHIVAHDGPDSASFWDYHNLQALCASCHSRKTATHDSAFARASQ